MRLMSGNPLGAARVAEEGLRAAGPGDPNAPRLHLLAGRARLLHEQQLSQFATADPAAFRRRKDEIAEEARRNPQQYRRNEAAGTWVYNGYHFRVIEKNWSRDPLADDAAWELTKLTFAGECDGNVSCYVRAELDPLLIFLEQHPGSELDDAAVARANSAFTGNLFIRRRSQTIPIPDLRSRAPGYDPAELRKLVERYTSVAARLPPQPRARAYETLGDLWTRFGEKKKALELYDDIIRNVPDYSNLDEIGRRARALAPLQ